jgi:uncharacterized membrane protein YczE
MTRGNDRDHDEARYAEVILVPNAAQLRRRLPPLLAGIVGIGIGIGLSVRAELGLAPWDVLHQGLSKVTGISIGVIVILAGIVVLLAWIPLRQKLGIGTVINTLTVGLVADATLAVVPDVHAMVVRVPMFVVALLAFGLGGGLYIGAGLGPGPRDGLMTAITKRGYRLWKVRTAIECSALVAGFLLGGSVGVGTVVIALTLGPLTHFALRRFHLPVHESAGEVLGE